jgi:transposase
MEKNMKEKENHPQKRRRYDDEFKADAVRQVLNTGKTAAEVARNLGINSILLARWKGDYLAREDARIDSGNGLTPSEADAEIRRLHRELESVKEDREILKKALKVFAQNRTNESNS